MAGELPELVGGEPEQVPAHHRCGESAGDPPAQEIGAPRGQGRGGQSEQVVGDDGPGQGSEGGQHEARARDAGAVRQVVAGRRPDCVGDEGVQAVCDGVGPPGQEPHVGGGVCSSTHVPAREARDDRYPEQGDGRGRVEQEHRPSLDRGGGGTPQAPETMKAPAATRRHVWRPGGPVPLLAEAARGLLHGAILPSTEQDGRDGLEHSAGRETGSRGWTLARFRSRGPHP